VSKPKETEEDFRDHIATVDGSGRRNWVYPSKPKGTYHRRRVWVALGLIAFLVIAPFIKSNGYPWFMLNLVERRFIFFGVPFWPQDLKILVVVFITMIVCFIVFTAVWGRLWCGWACPQTVFMEMVFRKIEYWIEGDAPQQRKLNEGPLNGEKILKKGVKMLVFVLLSYAVAHIFLAWIIGVESLGKIISEPIRDHLSGFIALNVFSFLFLLVFAWFREQACVIVCPYGRFQSVLLDPDTRVIHYDFGRGEPRGKKTKEETPGVGDCVDCGQCVRVCPTGIDIRHGTQLECVNCTACIDACDDIMDKVERPRGLIRFASYHEIKSGVKNLFSTRVLAYSIIMLALVGLSSFLLISRPDAHMTLTRLHGSVYQELDNGDILNFYRVKLANNTFEDIELSFQLSEGLGELRGPANLILPSYGSAETIINVLMPKAEMNSKKKLVTLEIMGTGGQELAQQDLVFIGPFLK
jgi:cytochrome c oxidase accessory protein FixG